MLMSSDTTITCPIPNIDINYHHSAPLSKVFKADPTWLNAFIAGAFGLSFSYAVMHPIDTLKTIIQTHPTFKPNGNKNTFSYSNLIQMLSRGFTASVSGAAIQGGLRLSSYELSKQYFPQFNDKDISTTTTAIYPIVTTTISALVGDLMSSIIKVPREIITCRMQTQFYNKDQFDFPRTAMQTAQRIVRDEGILALWKGFGPITARDGPFMVVLFVTYEWFKLKYHAAFGSNSIDGNSITWTQSTLFGGISGALAGFLTTPMDCLRTQVLLTASPSNQLKPINNGIISGLSLIYKNGGMRALYRGAVARSAWWFGICGIFFPSYEFVKDYSCYYTN